MDILRGGQCNTLVDELLLDIVGDLSVEAQNGLGNLNSNFRVLNVLLVDEWNDLLEQSGCLVFELIWVSVQES